MKSNKRALEIGLNNEGIVKEHPKEESTVSSSEVKDNGDSPAQEDDIHHEMIKHLRNIFASSTASIISTAASQPLIVLKEQIQLPAVAKESAFSELAPQKTTISFLHTARIMYIEHGLTSFWRGHTISQFVGLPQWVVCFWTFEQVRPLVGATATGDNMCNFVSGFVSGAVGVLALHPLEIIRIRGMARKMLAKRYGFVNMAHQLYKMDGWRTFYVGSYPTLMHVAPLFGFKFLFYNIICDRMLLKVGLENKEEMSETMLLAAGALSAFISNTIVYPMDVVKRNLRIHGLKRQQYQFDATCRRGIAQCFSSVLRREGMYGLYRGLLPCLMKSAVSTSVQFSIFDKMRSYYG